MVVLTKEQIDVLPDEVLSVYVGEKLKLTPDGASLVRSDDFTNFCESFDAIMPVAIKYRIDLEMPGIAKHCSGDPRIKGNWKKSKNKNLARAICEVFMMMKV